MKVLVALQSHFCQGPDGAYYIANNYQYPFWKRYLAVFDEVIVLARVGQVEEACPGWMRVDGPAVTVHSMPDFRGPWQYVQAFHRANAIVSQVVKEAHCYILRVPGSVGFFVERHLRKLGRRFAVEVVGDPWDSLAPGSVQSIVRPLARRLGVRNLRRQCRIACAACYVTSEALQNRYPPGPNTFSAACSDVELPKEVIANEPRDFTVAAGASLDQANSESRVWRLIFVGPLGNLYKGQDILLKAFQICLQSGVKVFLTLVGEGRYRPRLEAMVAKLGISQQVNFLGRLPSGRQVWEQLRRADLFVLPSRQEGLPRAMIEAMAAGLPCIGTRVGGIGELLTPEDMVRPEDQVALANRIIEVVGDPQRMTKMSQRNLKVARNYRSDILQKQRIEFYRVVREKAKQGLRV